MALRSAPPNTVWSFPFTPQDWEHTPSCGPGLSPHPTLRAELPQLHERVEALEARLTQNSTTSHRPPSSDSPYKKPRQRTTATTPQKAGGNAGHPGHRQALLPPTTVREVRPERCIGGHPTFVVTTAYHTHQVIELPPMAMDVTPWILHQGWCVGYGRWPKAPGACRACDGLWTTVQCAHGRVGWDVRERPTHGANLLRLGTRGPHQPGGHPEGPRPRDAGHRSILCGDCSASAAGPGQLHR